MFELKPCTNKAALYEIWQERFYDKTETIDKFFNLSHQNAFTLAVFENDIPVSVLYAIPEKITIHKIRFNALYIYAAATKKSAEHKGYMTKLLKHTEKIGKEKGFHYLFLVPVNKTLEKYYKKRGFYSAFKELNIEYKSKEIKPLKHSLNKENITRNNFLKSLNAVLWSNEEIALSREYSNFHFSNKNIWTTGILNSNKLILTDLMINEYSLKEGFSLIQNISGAKEIIADIPYELKNQTADFSIKEIHKGMALALTNSVPSLKNVYLGFTLA